VRVASQGDDGASRLTECRSNPQIATVWALLNDVGLKKSGVVELAAQHRQYGRRVRQRAPARRIWWQETPRCRRPPRAAYRQQVFVRRIGASEFGVGHVEASLPISLYTFLGTMQNIMVIAG